MQHTRISSRPRGRAKKQGAGCTTMLRHHGVVPIRGLQDLPRSVFQEGRFGRIFRTLPPFLPADEDLLALAALMIESEEEEEDARGDNPDIPAGFTYLGQFIDHDLTFDPNSKLQRENDPDALINFRTPRFDLDSVYGDGPADNPFLYQDDGVHFLIGSNAHGDDDLPRNSAEPRRALLGDPRNDENLIVAQLHLGFLKYHNQVADTLGICRPDLTGEAILEEARRIVRWHYQWLVIHEFLRGIAGKEVLEDILRYEEFKVGFGPKDGARIARALNVNLRFFHWKKQPFIPVEFSAAAYRFGHSLVRGDYALNAETEDEEVPIFGEEGEDLRGFRELPPDRVIEWARFFRFPEARQEPQPARRIDTKLALGLSVLPVSVTGPSPATDAGRSFNQLAVRNLFRGKALGLPAGQAVARAMGISPDLILSGRDLDLPEDLKEKFGDNAPLWFYVLREAGHYCEGLKLGPVGSRIVAEVFIGLIYGDPLSYLRIDPGWQPKKDQFGALADGRFTMADLLRTAGVKVE